MTDVPLSAHSLAEAKLYLLATPCPSCGGGPTRCVAERQGTPVANPPVMMLTARCGSCAHERSVGFSIPEDPARRSFELSDIINPTDEPSCVLDLAQWLTLATMLTESAKQESDKVIARQLRLEAGLCVDEALKFYVERANDLPPLEAFFTDETRTVFRQHPERYSRQRLRAMRLTLPAPRGA